MRSKFFHALRVLLVAIPAFVLCPPSASAATECTAASGAQRVALLELYTSEGCSSCPPADRWLSSLVTAKTVPANLLPLAFHVDYWNDIGWKDPYSQAAFSDRQREHSRRRGVSFVITPQLLLDGGNYRRPLLGDDIENKTQAINRELPRADIRIRQTLQAAGRQARIEVRVQDAAARRAKLFVALYENNLSTAVTAGENKGSLLKHDFVVRELAGPLSLDSEGRLTHDMSIRIDPRWKSADLRLAAFVQDPQTGAVLQALASDCR